MELMAEKVAEKVAERMSASLEGMSALLGKLAEEVPNANAASKVSQILLSLKYKELLHHQVALPSFRDVEFRAFSQNGEDGILLYLFSLLGTTNRRCVEICAGDGIQCNTANLIVNHGWTGLLFDGNEQRVAQGKEFYANGKDTFFKPPTFVQAWITAENVNSLVAANHFAGDIDLLSLDIDGMDYWVWKALDCIQPRVVLLESRVEWGPEKAVTIPYDPNFVMEFDGSPWYGGASLPAFVKLAREKGYRLVGSTRLGFNVFFIRCGLGEDVFPEVAASEITGEKVNLDWVKPEWVWVDV
jgi:hypothetical protein